MAKAIIVIEVPNDLCPSEISHAEVKFVKFDNMEVFRRRAEIKPIPTKRKLPEMYKDNFVLKAKIKGYNECIDNILGDKYGD